MSDNLEAHEQEDLSARGTIIQGFRANEELGIGPYVFIGYLDENGDMIAETEYSAEGAHILSEEIRKHAEFANSPATQEEK